MHKFTPKMALEVVAAYYDIPKDWVTRRCRKPEFTVPRHMGMSICYENMIPPGEIAKVFNTERTMPGYAWGKVEDRCRTDEGTRKDRDKIRELLTDGRKKVIQTNTSSVLSDT
jgi:chromosomal replication initiation ATPase DnaA